jgi:hypothetical protein
LAFKRQEQAFALMLIAQAEGMHPAIAARDYHIIQGRPSLKADAMLARFQQAGGKVEWNEYTDERVVGTFTHPKGGSVSVEWTIEMGRNANLTKNPDVESISTPNAAFALHQRGHPHRVSGRCRWRLF